MYATMVGPEDHLVCRSNSKYSFPRSNSTEWNYFIENKSEYESNFATEYAPYSSLIINSLFWSPGDPRILTNQEAESDCMPDDSL
jgi:hypothetical protein